MTPTIRRKLIPRGVLPPKIPETNKPSSEPVKRVRTKRSQETSAPEEPMPIDKEFKAKKSGKNPVEDIMEALRKGEAIMVKKEGVSSYAVSIIPNEVIVSKTFNNILKRGVIGKQYWEEVLNPEFTDWIAKWNAMTTTEKYDYAGEHKIEWKHAENQKLDIMNLTEAARLISGVQKYKPEYQSRQARARIRGLRG